jgi:hypothetical protein
MYYLGVYQQDEERNVFYFTSNQRDRDQAVAAAKSEGYSTAFPTTREEVITQQGGDQVYHCSFVTPSENRQNSFAFWTAGFARVL